MPERFEIDWGVSEAIRDFAQLRDVLGTSGGTAGSLSLIGGALGISDIRGAAEAMHRASLSGFGAAAASRYGIPVDPFATNRGEMLIRALEGLRETARGPGGMRQAILDARALNLEDWLGVVHLMDDQFARIKQEALATSDIYSPERVQQAIMMNFEMARFNRAVTDLGVVLGSLVIPHLTTAATVAADWIRSLSGGVGGRAEAPNPQAQLGRAMGSLQGAIQENTNTLRQIPGFYGGGARARTAIPAAFGIGSGQAIQQNLRSLSKTIGSMSMNF